MQALRRKLTYSTILPVLFGAGAVVAGGVAVAAQSQGNALNPAAVSRSANGIVVASADNPCNPCAAKKKNPCNPCNPCAAKNPCNPCAAKNPCAAAANPCNPCNPCAASAGGFSQKCNVPRLQAAANPCNPCAAKNPCAAAANPCNPCAAKNPCNPCAAKNPCNPCAAKNPCAAASNPCNPCNPCAAGDVPELTTAEATAAYNCLRDEAAAGYAKAGLKEMANYTSWTNVATSPYQAGTHGDRYVNNWVNAIGEARYRKYEELGTMPVGSVVAKDSFSVNSKGQTSAGPMFLMEKMANGFAPDTGNWRYTMIMPNGVVFGRTNGKNSSAMEFCAACHGGVAEDQDYLLLLPDEYRK